MSRALIVSLLAAATASAHIGGAGAGYSVSSAAQAARREESLGPVIRTGRYRVIQERILGGERDGYAQGPGGRAQAREPTLHLDRPFLRGRPEDALENGQQRFHYDGPNDGRRVWIYRRVRVQTPVRVVNGVIERLGTGQTVERWAEGGYKGAQNHNLEVYHRDGQEVFADRVIPIKSVFGGDTPL